MLNKIIPYKVFNNIARTSKLKTMALASTMALAFTGLMSCNNESMTQEHRMELKKDSIILTNQIQVLEKNLNKDDYATYGIDSTICDAKQSLKQIKQMTLEQKKAELSKIVAQLNQKGKEGMSSRLLKPLFILWLISAIFAVPSLLDD